MSIFEILELVATNVHLTTGLERFTRKCVKSRRYNSVSEVVRSGLRLLQEADDRRSQIQAMLSRRCARAAQRRCQSGKTHRPPGSDSVARASIWQAIATDF
ncbi:MAG TPA: type II toxin-antitoxin system ParD family antitoxin [Candidatus Binataceae bacterium]|nr:type II toxin-antitoxin system ParD family antitoxin [Candidatus Binataceae bacterium]